MISGIVLQAQLNAWKTILATSGEEITYWLTDEKGIAIRAVLSKPQPRTVDAVDTALIETKKWDWLVHPSCLVDPETSERFEPKRGHRIERCDGTSFRLIPGEGSDLLWRWNSAAKVWIRVHCEER